MPSRRCGTTPDGTDDPHSPCFPVSPPNRTYKEQKLQI
jgi:hypothetical protein